MGSKISKRVHKAKVFCLFVVAAVLFSGIGILQSSSSVIASTPEDCFEYTDNGDGTANITQYYYNAWVEVNGNWELVTKPGCTSDVVFPETINGLTVSAINESAAYGRYFTSFEVPGTVKELINSVFDGSQIYFEGTFLQGNDPLTVGDYGLACYSFNEGATPPDDIGDWQKGLYKSTLWFYRTLDSAMVPNNNNNYLCPNWFTIYLPVGTSSDFTTFFNQHQQRSTKVYEVDVNYGDNVLNNEIESVDLANLSIKGSYHNTFKVEGDYVAEQNNNGPWTAVDDEYEIPDSDVSWYDSNDVLVGTGINFMATESGEYYAIVNKWRLPNVAVNIVSSTNPSNPETAQPGVEINSNVALPTIGVPNTGRN